MAIDGSAAAVVHACGRAVCSEALRLSERRAISDTSSSVVVLDAGCF